MNQANTGFAIVGKSNRESEIYRTNLGFELTERLCNMERKIGNMKISEKNVTIAVKLLSKVTCLFQEKLLWMKLLDVKMAKRIK